MNIDMTKAKDEWWSLRPGVEENDGNQGNHDEDEDELEQKTNENENENDKAKDKEASDSNDSPFDPVFAAEEASLMAELSATLDAECACPETSTATFADTKIDSAQPQERPEDEDLRQVPATVPDDPETLPANHPFLQCDSQVHAKTNYETQKPADKLENSEKSEKPDVQMGGLSCGKLESPSQAPAAEPVATCQRGQTSPGVAGAMSSSSSETLHANANVMDGSSSCREVALRHQISKVQNPKIATCLEEGLNFTEHYLTHVENLPEEELPAGCENGLELLADRLCEQTNSTSFSGIEAPHCSRLLLHQKLEERLGRKLERPRLMHAVEWNAACQKEIIHMLENEGDESCCVFGDICGFFREELTAKGGLIDGLKKNPSVALETLAPLLEAGKLIKRSAWCIRHQCL